MEYLLSVSERGPQFVSQVWEAFCNALGATVSLTSGYHPQSNGQTERSNQELEASLWCVVSGNSSNWSQHQTWVAYAHNTTHTHLQLLAFHLLRPLWAITTLFPSVETEYAVSSVQIHFRSCCRFWRQTKKALLQTTEQNKRIADRYDSTVPSYRVGQRMWLSTKDFQLTDTLRKLAPWFIGPFPVE